MLIAAEAIGLRDEQVGGATHVAGAMHQLAAVGHAHFDHLLGARGDAPSASFARIAWPRT
jgi:hypothetical protein